MAFSEAIHPAQMFSPESSRRHLAEKQETLIAEFGDEQRMEGWVKKFSIKILESMKSKGTDATVFISDLISNPERLGPFLADFPDTPPEVIGALVMVVAPKIIQFVKTLYETKGGI